MKQIDLYLTEEKMERLHKRSKDEGVVIAELVRRAVDAYLAWDDPTYRPEPPTPQTRNGDSSPP